MALWTPDKLDDLFSWWKADSLSLSNDDLVETWGDSSSNSYSVTASGGARPQFKTNLWNGKPAIYFGGSQYLTSGTTNDWKFLHDTTGSTVLAVWQAGTAADPNTQYGLCGTGALDTVNTGSNIRYDDRTASSRNDRIIHIVYRGASLTFAVANDGGDDSHAANQAKLLSVVGDPNNATAANRSVMHVNGAAALKNNTQTDSPSSNNPTYPLQLGTVGNATLPLVGYIAELIICDAILSTEERQKGEGYLAHKYGLEDDLPAGHPYKKYPPGYRGIPIYAFGNYWRPGQPKTSGIFVRRG